MTIVCFPYSWIEKMFTESDGPVNDPEQTQITIYYAVI